MLKTYQDGKTDKDKKKHVKICEDLRNTPLKQGETGGLAFETTLS